MVVSCEVKTLRVLALHGFGGNFGNDEAPEDFCHRLEREMLQRLSPEWAVRVLAPLAPNSVANRHPAWLAGDQRPLGLVAGFAYSDDWVNSSISYDSPDSDSEAKAKLPPKLDSVQYPEVFGMHICERVANDMAEYLRSQHASADSRSTSLEQIKGAALTSRGQAQESKNPALRFIWHESEGWDRSLKFLQDTWSEEGPFDVIFGFSQGCLAALLLLAAMEKRGHSSTSCRSEANQSIPRKKQKMLEPDLSNNLFDHAVNSDLPKCLVLVGAVGIRPWPVVVQDFWPVLISERVRVLNVIGSEDRVVAPCRSREVRLVCRPAAGSPGADYAEYEHHVPGTAPHGGHLVPNTADFFLVLTEFIKNTLST